MAEPARQLLERPVENQEQTALAVLQRDVAHIDRRLTEFKDDTGKRFDSVDKRFDSVGRRFDMVDTRFMWVLGAFGTGFVLLLTAFGVGFVDLLDRQDAMRQEFTRRFEAVDARFDRQDAKLEELKELVRTALANKSRP